MEEQEAQQGGGDGGQGLRPVEPQHPQPGREEQGEGQAHRHGLEQGVGHGQPGGAGACGEGVVGIHGGVEQTVEGAADAQVAHPLGQHGGIGVKECHQRGGAQLHRGHGGEGHRHAEAHSRPTHRRGPAELSGPRALARHGGHRGPHRPAGQGGVAVELQAHPGRRGRGDAVGVEHAGHQQVGQVEHRRLDGGGQAGAEDGQPLPAIDPAGEGEVRPAAEPQQGGQEGQALGQHGGRGRPGGAQGPHQQEVQRHVDYRGQGHEPQGALGVPQAPQQGAHGVVAEHEGGAQAQGEQVARPVRQGGAGEPHGREHRAAQQGPGQGEQGGGQGGEGEQAPHRPPEGVPVPRAHAVGGQHPAALGQAGAHGLDDIAHHGGAGHAGQAVAAHQAAHHRHVHHAVAGLEQVGQQDGEGEPGQPGQDGPGEKLGFHRKDLVSSKFR